MSIIIERDNRLKFILSKPALTWIEKALVVVPSLCDYDYYPSDAEKELEKELNVKNPTQYISYLYSAVSDYYINVLHSKVDDKPLHVRLSENFVIELSQSLYIPIFTTVKKCEENICDVEIEDVIKNCNFLTESQIRQLKEFDKKRFLEAQKENLNDIFVRCKLISLPKQFILDCLNEVYDN